MDCPNAKLNVKFAGIINDCDLILIITNRPSQINLTRTLPGIADPRHCLLLNWT